MTGREPLSRDDDRRQAFARHVVPEIEVLYRVARSITRRPADAEDLVQDTLLRAYRAIAGFDGRHPRAWLLTILRNTHINRNRRRRPELLRDADQAAREAEPDWSSSPESVVLDRAFDDAVKKAFAALPERLRTVLELVDIHGLTYQEAADVMGIPVGTVMSRLHRARARIRRKLDPTQLGPVP